MYPRTQAAAAVAGAAQEECDKRDDQVRIALRLSGRVRAALKGEGNPYAVGDARKAKEARVAALRAAVHEAFPELAGLDGSLLDGAVTAIEAEIDDRKLSEIL